MSDKFLFQNARIKAMETRLLSPQQLQRLLDCGTAAEAFKLLLELGFGQGVSAEAGDFDKLFEHEENSAIATVRNFNADGMLDAFLLLIDYHNMKALLKAAAVGDDKPATMAEGLYSLDDLKEGIAGEVRDLPREMGDAVTKLNRLIADGKITARIIDTVLDRAAYADVLAAAKRGGRAVTAYFVSKIDYLNVSTYFRCRRLNQSERFFTDAFIDGGTLDKEFFTSMYEGAVEILKDKCKFTPYGGIVGKLVDDGNLVAYEVAVDNALLAGWREEYNDLFSSSPVVYYYFAKLTELKVVKLVVAGLKNHVDPALIKERMREIYGA